MSALSDKLQKCMYCVGYAFFYSLGMAIALAINVGFIFLLLYILQTAAPGL